VADFGGPRGNYVVDAVAFMKQAQDTNRKILIEGANALMVRYPVAWFHRGD
jgi:adenylosuccinate synthase